MSLPTARGRAQPSPLVHWAHLACRCGIGRRGECLTCRRFQRFEREVAARQRKNRKP